MNTNSATPVPALASAYIAMVREGVVRDLAAVRRMKAGITRHGLEDALEPLSRALDYVLTGDLSHLQANQIVADVTRDVLTALYAAGVPAPAPVHTYHTEEEPNRE